jgi:alkanesulfonate monooxygenase SsuD/methylene tetrahydromethanopterin reductase-like flavin-dependent oxidoreductase (luciferase family)
MKLLWFHLMPYTELPDDFRDKHPSVWVAEEFAMIDCISGGRLIAGFPVGTPMDTCFAYGQNPSLLRERYYEAHDLVMRAWTERETFAFNGRFNQQRYINIWPRPIQTPHPPVWIPGGGSVETWQWCAAKDYVYSYLSYFGYKAGRATMDGFWTEMERLGKDRNPYRAGFLQFVGVAESRAEALELYAEAAEYFYGRCLHVSPTFAMPPGYISEATQRAGIESQVQRAAGAAPPRYQDKFQMLARQMNDIVERGYVIVGSPDEVAEQLREVALNLNVGHLMLLLQFGNMSKELTRYNTQLFAERVMPQLQSLFADWEDRWWPHPMATATRAQPAPFRPHATAAG